MIITSNDLASIYTLKIFLSHHFYMKDLGRLHYFLGLEILFDSDGYYLSQVKYSFDILACAGITDCKIAPTPLETNVKLTPLDGTLLSDATLYHSLVYLIVTRPDIAYVVHLAGDLIDRRSTTGFCFFLDMGISHSNGNILYCDNQSAIYIAHNNIFHECTKHIEIDYHVVRQQVAQRTVHLDLSYLSVMEKNCYLVYVTFTLLVHVYSLMACLAETNIATDQSALFTLKSHINSDPHNTRRHHRVAILNLSYIGLRGTIPPYIGNLSFLPSLDIRNNSFYGDIPKKIGHLHRLKDIILPFNDFTGNLPEEIGKLANLGFLDVVSNRLSGSIPASIFNISSLGIIDLTIVCPVIFRQICATVFQNSIGLL
ncbi:receptor like protein 22-like [Cornus florida]|uniref:receptor like protein 22-like n=1 Tax=Cornus florida TaxID=4283 RepID=UPI00289B7478|nr:receptor like protein 22-like [Cornus florida]